MLKPLAMRWDKGRSAVTVEWPGLKPCWETDVVRACVRYGSKSRSRILAAAQRREIGLYDVPFSFGFPGLGMGMMVEFFQMAGMVALAIEML